MNWIKAIEIYTAYNEQERKEKEIILKCIKKYDDLLTRNNEIIHITGSSFVINHNKDKLLMVYHKIYDSWSWTGGHADGEEDILSVAMRETWEETGVKNIRPISKNIFSLDIITVAGHIRRGEYVSPHLHISLTYLIEADENEPLVINPMENKGVQWIPFQEINIYSNEPHMKKIYSKILAKIMELTE